MLRIIIVMLLLALFPSIASAVEKTYAPIPGEKIKQLLTGKTIVGEYRFMRERTKTYNFSEVHHKDGSTDYVEGPITSKGVWYTLGTHKICYKYPDDPNMGAGISCFWVYKQDTCYYSYGRDAMSLKGPRAFEDWSARWIIKGSGGSCDEPVS